MNQQEAAEFLDRVFLCFPGLAQWVAEFSHNARETFAFWRDELRNVSREEAEDVLRRWNNGTLDDAPAGYHRERFMPNLLTHVRNAQAEKRRKELQATTRETIGRKPEGQRLPSLEGCYAACRNRLANGSGEPARTAAEIAREVYAAAELALEESRHGN